MKSGSPGGVTTGPFFMFFRSWPHFGPKVLPGTLPRRSWDLIFTYFVRFPLTFLSILGDFCAAMDRIFTRCLADLLSAFLVLCGVWCVLCVVWCATSLAHKLYSETREFLFSFRRSHTLYYAYTCLHPLFCSFFSHPLRVGGTGRKASSICNAVTMQKHVRKM